MGCEARESGTYLNPVKMICFPYLADSNRVHNGVAPYLADSNRVHRGVAPDYEIVSRGHFETLVLDCNKLHLSLCI